MPDQNPSPYSSPRESAGSSQNIHESGSFSSSSRIGAGVASIATFLFAFGGYIAWSIADFYSISDQTHFDAVLGVAIGLGVTALFWMFFAIIGHRLIPRTANMWALGVSGVLAVPACIFVTWFFA